MEMFVAGTRDETDPETTQNGPLLTVAEWVDFHRVASHREMGGQSAKERQRKEGSFVDFEWIQRRRTDAERGERGARKKMTWRRM
jgi:hypothetical protein